MEVLSYWSCAEIKLAIEFFFEKLSAILRKKPTGVEFEKWYSVKLSFQSGINENALQINYLQEIDNSIDNVTNRTCSMLRSLQTESLDITWEFEDVNSLIISPNSVYDYWRQKYSPLETVSVARSFTVPNKVGVSFGGSSEKRPCAPWKTDGSPPTPTGLQNVPSSEKISLNVAKNNNVSGSQNFHSKAELIPPQRNFSDNSSSAKRSPSDNPFSAKRKISFGSSCSISPHTPELRSPVTLAERSTGCVSTVVLQQTVLNSCGLNSSGGRSSGRTSPDDDINKLQNFRCVWKMPIVSPQNSGFKSSESMNSAGSSPKKTPILSPHQISPLHAITQSAASTSCKGSPIRQHLPSNRFPPPQQPVGNNPTLKTTPTNDPFIFSTPLEGFLKDMRMKSSRPEACQEVSAMRSKHVEENDLASESITDSIIQDESSKTQLIKRKTCKPGLSVINHNPELSVFTEPPKSRLKSKRPAIYKVAQSQPSASGKIRLSTPAKRSFFSLSTPNKYFKAVRPVTPILKASSLRARTPLSFRKTPKIVTPVPTKLTKQTISTSAKRSECELNEDDDTPTSTVTNCKLKRKSRLIDFKNFTISLPVNSLERKVSSSNTKELETLATSATADGIRKISASALEKTSTVMNPPNKLPPNKFRKPANSFLQRPIPVSAPQRAIIKGPEKDDQRIKVHRASCSKSRFSSNVSNEEFKRVVSFLKIKVNMKCKLLDPAEQEAKAKNLAQTFVQKNTIERLDKKSMKLLNEFAEIYI